jgi:hypothetical protein
MEAVMQNVRETVNKVVDIMMKEHGPAYTAGYLNTFLIRVIENGVPLDSMKETFLFELLNAGIEAKSTSISKRA